MDALDAASLAECMEYELGAAETSARVECFAVPRRPASSRRRTPWAFLVVTDVPERTVHETLTCMDVETVERRGSRRVHVAWPKQESFGWQR